VLTGRSFTAVVMMLQGNTAEFVLRLFSVRHFVLCRSPKGDRASAEGNSRSKQNGDQKTDVKEILPRSLGCCCRRL